MRARRPAYFSRCVALFLVILSLGMSFCRGEDSAQKHYLTFQIGYRGTASQLSQDASGQRETNVTVNDLFSGRIEAQPTEAYDLPTSAEAQMKQAEAMRAAVMAGDAEKLTHATPPLLVTWFPRGDAVDIAGTISETKTSSVSQIAHGESRASSDQGTESYKTQSVFQGNIVNAFVKIHPVEKTYDIQFTLMPDMATTMEAVHQVLVKDHKEEGHDTHEASEAQVPLDMGPGQIALGYSNYQMVADVKGLLLAGGAGELVGTTRIPVPKPAGWDGEWDIALNVSWQIDVTLPPVELVITIPGYDEWRPEGNIKEVTKPGNKLVARATVAPTVGQGTFVPKVKNIRLELLDSSREPGVCMNWPLDAKDKDYDLRLVAVAGGELSKSDQILKVIDPHKNDAGQYYAETQIDSYDFGGRASLRAVCLLNDGREIEGVMKDVGEMPKLPKMKSPGWVADSWKKAHHVEKFPDDDDDEKIEGQKDNGDGFTLYEEYRGWVENGKHIEGDPKGKDLFVLNLFKAKADAQNGINLFAALSKLRVHSKLRPSEMSETTRLMNGNRRDAPKNKDQHGVWVKVFTKAALGDEGAKTVLNKAGVAGRPALVDGIGILARNDTESIFNQPFNLPARDMIMAYDRAIAHELLHSVGVEHHGDANRDYKIDLFYIAQEHPQNRLGRAYFATSISDYRPIGILYETGQDFAADDAITFYIQSLRQLYFSQYLDKARRAFANAKSINQKSNYATPEVQAETEFLDSMALNFGQNGKIVGVENGADSGDQDCVMRYYFAEFYEAKNAKGKTLYKVTSGTERIGIDICHSGKGTGINAPSHEPQSRYGDAASDAGNCFEQICPNDAITPRAVKK